MMIAFSIRFQKACTENISLSSEQIKVNTKAQIAMIKESHEKLVKMLNDIEAQIRKNEEKSWWERLVDAIVNVVQVIIGVVEVCCGNEVSGAANIAAGVCGLAKDFCQLLEACHIGDKKAEDEAIKWLGGLSTFFQGVALLSDVFSIIVKPVNLIRQGISKLFKEGGTEALADTTKAGSKWIGEVIDKQALKEVDKAILNDIKAEVNESIENAVKEMFKDLKPSYLENEVEEIEMKVLSGDFEEVATVVEENKGVLTRCKDYMKEQGLNILNKVDKNSTERAAEFLKKAEEKSIKKIANELTNAATKAVENADELTQKIVNDIVKKAIVGEACKVARGEMRFIAKHIFEAVAKIAVEIKKFFIQKEINRLELDQSENSAARDFIKNQSSNLDQNSKTTQQIQKQESEYIKESSKRLLEFLEKNKELRDNIITN